MTECSLLSHLVLKDYGVLGTQRTTERTLVQVAPEPSDDTVIVDPAGLDFIQKPGRHGGGPANARGASGAIYEWLGIRTHETFPVPVREAIQIPGKAKFFQYEARRVIHVVGPNLHTVHGNCSEVMDTAIDRLATAYANVFSEVLPSGATSLRLLPISGGIFAGRFAEDIPWMTFAALDKGFRTLPVTTQSELLQRLGDGRIEVCIFGAGVLPEYTAALARRGAPPEGGPKVLSALWPGALALISGLVSEKAQQFNGTICTVLASPVDGKFPVELDNGSKATLPCDTLRLADGGGLVPGIPATVHGLKSEKAEKYNGTQVTLKAWNREATKWSVKLPDGIGANIPAANLRVVAATEELLQKEKFPTDLF